MQQYEWQLEFLNFFIDWLIMAMNNERSIMSIISKKFSMSNLCILSDLFYVPLFPFHPSTHDHFFVSDQFQEFFFSSIKCNLYVLLITISMQIRVDQKSLALIYRVTCYIKV